MSRCLVTGGAGFIGSHLTERLLSDGHEVVVLDDLSTGRKGNLSAVKDHPALRLIRASITDPQAVTEATAGTEVIYHLAAAVGVKLVADDPARTIETNIQPTETLLRAAAAGGQRFFLASTSEVYGKNPKERWTEEDDLVFGPTARPRWAYGCSKAIDEFLALAYCQKYGFPVIIGRFFNVVGPRQVGAYGMVIPRFVRAALDGEPLQVYDDGSQERCFAHVGEVVDHVVRLINHPGASGRVWNLGADEPVTMRELAETVVELTGSSSAIEFVPYEKTYGSNFEDIQRRVPDTSALEGLLGTAPSMPLREILADVIAHARANRTGR
ncbi:NAD-dependent epimerase/dehydratase family protein [Alienimonas californiensis]|uniref:dTDP-glucose 4,6-dehydratase n=1 Tax=Alienimonas californiensis TaxID=2527989 RepID=A0A517P9T0_9PLAN|nr:NAD-dependent epimerase/dehydratase family protein [Alienimonas californiensis]QDT16115.1 dTDP-glucose 4,6-dehydratase [Alienimonas californiensis]